MEKKHVPMSLSYFEDVVKSHQVKWIKNEDKALNQIAQWRSEGLEMVPCCDNIDSKGYCLGTK